MTLDGLRGEIASTRAMLRGDLWAQSASNPNHYYRMILTPEGIAVHLDEGCEAEQFYGVLECPHSKGHSSMTTEQALVRAEAILTPAQIEFNEDQLAVIKNTIAKGVTTEELALFISTCKRTGLDPFMKQIYAITRWDAKAQKEVMGIQVGIDGQRLIAERSDRYAGQDPIEWLDENGQWSEVWTAEGEHPVAARCSVYRKDWPEGRKATAIARWDSYAVTYKDSKTNTFKLGPMWAKMGDVMIGKCAESLALRRAFPAEMSAVAAMTGQPYDPSLEPAYLAEEVGEVENVVEGEFTATEVEEHIAEAKSGNLEQESDETPPVDTACPEGGEHAPQYDKDLTVLKCSKCGAKLEGPDA